MQLNENPLAFCETFDQPNLVTNRSGELSSDRWGVQRKRRLINREGVA